LVEAQRGAQVEFAAPGADMAAAQLHQAYALVRGTSFASPIVAGLLALELHTPDPGAAQHAVATLAGRALDLGAPALILFTATDWWVRICAGSRRSRVWGHIKSNRGKFPVPRKISQGRVVVLSEGSRTGRGLLKETTMRTRHLFTSAAIAAVLAVAVPVHAQILGGGAQGGLGGTLGGTLGGGAAACAAP